jgi:hypothetical protein
MANNLHLPDNTRLASKIIETRAQQQSRRDEMGILGRIMGGAAQKAGNVAGFAILFASAMLALLIFQPPPSPAVPVDQLLPIFRGIITLALGYMFGRGSS